MTKARQWILKQRPVGKVTDKDLVIEDVDLPAPAAGEVLIRTIYCSLDPSTRIWMSDMPQYMPPNEVGDIMRAGVLGVVEQSGDPNFAEGDVVSGLGGLGDRMILPTEGLGKLPQGTGIPWTAFMSILGFTGLTAYYGVVEIADVQPGETFVINAAAGAVGAIACQIAKIRGARVIAIAGADDKCAYLKDELGVDEVINYKTEDVGAKLDEYCPDGIDVDFENVGGNQLDEILARMKIGGRIALCGLISTYNEPGPVPAPYNFAQILMKRLNVKGLIVSDYMPRAEEGLTVLGGWLMEGKLKYEVDIVDGLDNAMTALDRLFTGANRGRQLLKVGEEV